MYKKPRLQIEHNQSDETEVTMDSFTLALDRLTGKSVSLYLITNVENTPEIRKKLMSGEIECCVIKAALIVDPFQVAVAANKAALREHNSCLTTKSIFTEILYVMSSSSNISQSLIRFGIHDKDKNIVVALIHSVHNESQFKDILRHIKGHVTPISRINEFTDKALVKKTYNIEEEELKVSSLLDSVVSRISNDNSVSLK